MRSLTALIAVVVPLEALAVSPGGTFAGPANPSGAALVWNPASLAALDDSWGVLFDASSAFIHIEYERAGAHPSTGNPYPHTEFRTITPDLNFAAVAPTPLDGLKLFVGGFTPGVLGSRWPEDGPQRFAGTNSTFLTYAVCAGAAYRMGENYGIAAGAGPVYGNLAQRV